MITITITLILVKIRMITITIIFKIRNICWITGKSIVQVEDVIIFGHKILQPWLNTLLAGANVAGTPRKFC